MNWLLRQRTIHNRRVFVATSMIFGPPTVGLLTALYYSFSRGGPYPDLTQFGIIGASVVFVSYLGGALPALFTSLLIVWLRRHLSLAEILALACAPMLIALIGSLLSAHWSEVWLVLAATFIPAVLGSVALAARWGAFEALGQAADTPTP